MPEAAADKPAKPTTSAEPAEPTTSVRAAVRAEAPTELLPAVPEKGATEADDALDAWREWQEAPWGRLRYTLAESNLLRHLDRVTTGDRPLRVLDLGGGDGGDAVRLAARGHRVTLADHAPAMLLAARRRAEAAGLADRVECVAADVTAFPWELAEGDFDVVLCHNVLPYVSEARALLAVAVGALRPGGLLSVMALNRHAVALNIAVREGDPAAARAALDREELLSRTFGARLKPYVAADVADQLRELGCQGVRHYGIRSFCDYFTDDARKHDPEFYAELERLELAVTDREPYVHAARLFQLTAFRRKP